MRLRIFQSEKGDCLLLQSTDGRNILCDGGMARSMRNHVRGLLNRLVGDGMLDFVYVSHIDQDHISGVLQLLNDALEWRVFDHHAANGDNSVREPRVPRPPRIGGLWHNAFRDQITRNRGAIQNLLAAAAPVLFGTGIREFQEEGEEALKIATSIPEALKVSRLIQPDLLDIPLNTIPGQSGPARLLYFRGQPTTFPVGSLNISVIGPTASQLRALRRGWDNWLRANRDRVRSIRRELQRRVDEFSTGALSENPFDLHSWNGIPGFRGVTTPNVASLVLLVEENGRRLLLTGDSQQDVILEALESSGNLVPGHIHLDVLKVQHHGSEHNLDADFSRQVSADHYVFCGDGSDGNPEPEVLQHVFESRLGPANRRALSPRARDRRFTFWFSTTSASPSASAADRDNFREVEELVARMIARSGGQMRAEFTRRNYRTLTV